MAKEIAVVAIHGMGDTQLDFCEIFKNKLSKMLGEVKSAKIHFDSVFYQNILQPNETAVFQRMEKEEIDWKWLRRFMLFGFSDAIGLERNQGNIGSPYTQAQEAIQKTLNNCSLALGGFDKPIIFAAHSLGCQLLSNYIWDSQTLSPTKGVWVNNNNYPLPEQNAFYRLKTLHALFTLGCNIPIFVAGFPQNQIVAIKTDSDGYNFKWYNFYDKDDVLGWPLKPINASYNKAVTLDREINVSGGIPGWFLKSWNILSHSDYFSENKVLRSIYDEIQKFV